MASSHAEELETDLTGNPAAKLKEIFNEENAAAAEEKVRRPPFEL